MELRGHDNVVEVVVFAPISAYKSIQELAGLVVSIDPSQKYSRCRREADENPKIG